MQVDTAELEKAAQLLDNVIPHFRARRNGMQEVLDENPGSGTLTGGYGRTGAFQHGLQRFSVKFNEILGDFVADEELFCLFLEGFRDRLRQSAGTYTGTELRNTGSFSRIGDRLSAGEG